MKNIIPGLVASMGIAAIVLWGKHQISFLETVSPLLISIALGIVISHALPNGWKFRLASGLNVAKGTVLRTAIVLYGFNITFQAFADIGLYGVLSAVIMVATILSVGVWLGRRLFGLDTEQSILVAAGSAICGAAAVAAFEPIINAKPHKVLTAISTVVVFGTLSMLMLPILLELVPLTHHQYGLWAGVSIHEVAQVVVAGDAISESAAHIAVLEKMFRVVLLVPVLLIVAIWTKYRFQGSNVSTVEKRITVPWFAFLFIGVIVINSLEILPSSFIDILSSVAMYLLCVAMAALGILTHFSVIKQGGLQAFGLAAILFVLLLVLGFGLAAFG
ncbi:hypothetical protein BFR57_08910 [Idiomarina sp. MD25a]|uniref:YeiH family protein n=1 Tax=Idiomarina sp. MD25a TaxID=1889913 RepID=UPI0008F96987|nr:putative sulfate exporter family transporter [Idiomarina sp. MD25a]OIN02156.1 hypothetical protein BFR57_08910 [Idiomarina sp. MD25a]